MDAKTEKFAISIDPLIARVDWYEAPTLQDLEAVRQQILRDSRYHENLRLLLVDHGTDLSMTEPQIQAAVEAMVPLAKKFKSSALAVSNDAHYKLARQFSSHFLRHGIVSGAFKDDVAAGVWLLRDNTPE